MLLAAGVTVDRYEVEGLLGEGGIAEVYLARHASLGVLRALKVVRVSSVSVRDRLMQEGRIQARLNHPNVVAVVDVVTAHDSPVLVMEFVPGPSLYAMLYERRVRLAQASALAQGILAGVASAHRQGLVHRDLKPANILLDPTDGRIVPRVADFGLAKVLALDLEAGGPLTRSNATMGTPAYMAPEQHRNSRHVDARADVFALGAILYELVVGRPAFPQDDLYEILKASREESYAPLAALVPDLGERRIAAIVKALRPNPADRHIDAGALLEAWGVEAEDPAVWEDLPALAERLRPSIITSTVSAAPSLSAADVHPDPADVSSPRQPRAAEPELISQTPAPSVSIEPTPIAPEPSADPGEPRAPGWGPAAMRLLLIGALILGIVVLAQTWTSNEATAPPSGSAAPASNVSTPPETPPAAPTPPTPGSDEVDEADTKARTLDIRFSGGAPQVVDLECGDVRRRETVTRKRLHVEDLPRNTACVVSVKGGVSPAVATLSSGGSYTCTISAGLMRCR